MYFFDNFVLIAIAPYIVLTNSFYLLFNYFVSESNTFHHIDENQEYEASTLLLLEPFQ